jgi:hypothetical protein
LGNERKTELGEVDTSPAFLVDMKKYLSTEDYEKLRKSEEAVLKSWLARSEFLQALAERGAKVNLTCAELKLNRNTLSNWLRVDPIFKKVYEEIRVRCKDRVPGGGDSTKRTRKKSIAGTDPAKKKVNWRVKYAAEYRATGSKVKAAEAVGKKVREIMDALDKQSEFYDKEFQAVMAEEEARNLSEIEDNLVTKAKEDPNSAKFMLQSFMPDKYKPERDAKGVNVYWFEAGGTNKAKNFMRDLFGENKSPLLLDVGGRGGASQDA